MTWIAIKLFAGQAWSFIAKYWRIILIALILGALFFYKSRYESTVQELADYKAEIAQQAKVQQAKNKLLRKQSETVLNDVMATHKESLTVEKLDRKRETDKLKGSINEISNELNIYRDATRLRNSTTSGVRVPTLAEDTIRSASTSGNCNQTLATVVDACKVTDYDYEALYNLYKRQCDIYGCE